MNVNKIYKKTLLFSLVCLSASAFSAQLEEVLVTAQKKVESVQDIPIAIGVVSGDSLEKFSITSTADLDDATPGLVIQEAPGNLSSVTVRGVGTAPGNESFDQSVSLFIDGVWAGRQREFSSALFDIERIEVIKGTQNSLLGKNTSLGAISLITKNPGDTFSASLSTDYELEYGSKLLTGSVDVPVGDNLLTRFSVNYKDKVGDVENIITGELLPQTEQLALRFKAAFDISDIGDAVFTYQTESLEILGDNFQYAFDTANQIVDQAPGTLIGVDSGKKSSYTSLGKNGDSWDQQDSQRMNFTANFDVNDYQLTAVTGYSRYFNQRLVDADFTPQDFLFQETDSNFEQISQELRITGPEGIYFDYTLGMFFLKNQFSKRIPTYGLVPLFTTDDTGRIVPGNDALTPLLENFRNENGNFDVFRLCTELADCGALANVVANVLGRVPATIGGLLNGEGLSGLQFDELLQDLESVWKTNALNNNDLALLGLNGAFESFFDQSTYVRSFFGQSTFYVLDNVNVTTGLRYTNEKKIAEIERAELSPGLIHQLSYPLYPRESLSLSEKSLDGSINLQYYFADDDMAYVTWGKGTKSGGFADQATLREDVPYDREVATTTEIGIKLNLLDGAARLNAAAFNTDIEDYQYVVFVGLGFETSNLQAVSRGVEFDLQMALSENLFLNTSATYAKAKDKDTGLGLPLSPALTSNLGVHYENILRNGLGYSVDFGVNYRSKMYHNLAQAEPVSEAVSRYDARIALYEPSKQWELALIGKNLTDEIAIAISGDAPGIADKSAAVAATEGRRTFTLQAKYNFE